MKLLLSPRQARRFAKVAGALIVATMGAVPQAVWGAQGVLDYERFMRDIQPLLLTRQYTSPAAGTTCFSCHGSTSTAAFDAFPLFQDRPRDNFISTAREVKLDQPDTSLVLLKPLALAAGGVPHGEFGNDGGEQFQNTTTDTAYAAIRNWIVDATRSSIGARVTRTEPYPNPFRFTTEIVYILSTEAREVKVTLFTSSGHALRSFTGSGLVGANRVTWDGRDEDNEPLPTGIYFYTVKATFDDGTAVKAGKCVYTP
jgi:hypothetical protein